MTTQWRRLLAGDGDSASAPLVRCVAVWMKSARPWVSGRKLRKHFPTEFVRCISLSQVSSRRCRNAAGALQALPGSPGNPPTISPPGYGTGGRGPGGSFSTTPPPTTTGAPGANLPNLDQMRNSTPQQPQPRQPIQSNLVCADCDPLDGGGGGSYYPAGDPDFSVARERPEDEIGNPGVNGVDLGSRNFNWSLPLLSLPGRAGMDLNLTLYYNSLVWTRMARTSNSTRTREILLLVFGLASPSSSDATPTPAAATLTCWSRLPAAAGITTGWLPTITNIA